MKQIEITGVVVEVTKQRTGRRPAIEKCAIVEAESGIRIDGLPCAGLELKPGYPLSVTISIPDIRLTGPDAKRHEGAMEAFRQRSISDGTW